MSKNLGRADCEVCGSKVEITGIPYARGDNLPEYEGMHVADADCTVCGAKYTAWIGPLSDDKHGFDFDDFQKHGFWDLSYRSTFNDEPGEGDAPTGEFSAFRIVLRDGEEIHRESVPV